jgi:putative transcriptional regulator
MPSAHPTAAMLRDYAGGYASEGVSLLVAAHATYCPTCRDAIARIEALNGALLREEAAPEPDAGALDAVMARVDAPGGDHSPCRGPEAATRDALLPAPLAALVGPCAALRWRFAIPGVSRVDLGGADGEEITLLRVRPGAGVPAHTHTGVEATLVLSGALRDRGAVFGVGDVAIATSADDHQPRAEPGADCICLAVVTGRMRFTGPFGRALNIFAE